MKIFTIFLFYICVSKSQDYKVTCFGVHIGDITQKNFTSGNIEYDMKSRGLVDMIWPTKNNYHTSFDSKTFSLKSWKKDIKHGLTKYSISAEIDSVNTLLNYKRKSVQSEGPLYTIFNMLAMIQSLPYDKIDTKWFSYEHQGNLGKARFLWSDSSMVWDGSDSIMCDHYRMDIDIIDSTFSLGYKEDYFMNSVIDENYIKEFWVKRGTEKKIIQVSFRNQWLVLVARTDQ